MAVTDYEAEHGADEDQCELILLEDGVEHLRWRGVGEMWGDMGGTGEIW